MARIGKFNILTDFRSFSRLVENGTVFCAFDTETTGLHSENDRIIEIGAVKFTKEGVLGSFGSLVDPGMPISPAASAVNHITDEMVRGFPREEAVIPDFEGFAAGTVLVAHNAQFDIRFVNAALARLSRPPLANCAIDTLRLTRALFPTFGHWNLGALAERFGIDAGNAHRALDDARVCMEIFLRSAGSCFPRKSAERADNERMSLF